MILDPRGETVLYEEIRTPYWERILEPGPPGTYAFLAEGCATLRVYQASKLQGSPGLVLGKLDPREGGLRERALQTSIALLALAAITWAASHRLRAAESVA